MVKVKVYLKTGQCFDVVAKKIWCNYSTFTGELTSFKVVQFQNDEGENDAVD